MSKSLTGDDTGVSQVIEAVIITAVGIVIAIAVMLWISGLVGSSMGYENIMFVGQNCYLDSSQGVFRVEIRVKNTGSSTRISDVLINSVPVDHLENVGLSWVAEGGDSGESLPIMLATGVNVDIELTIPEGIVCGGGVLTSGVTISVKLHSIHGADYPATITLP